MLMAQILRPCLIFFWCLASLAAQKREGLPKTMRVEIFKAAVRERFFEYRSDWPRVAPVLSSKPNRLKLALGSYHDHCGRKKRIIHAPKLLSTKENHPI